MKMKKLFATLMVAVAATAMFSSCSKDDDDDRDNVVGNYNVIIDVATAQGGFSIASDIEATLTVAKDGDGLKVTGNFSVETAAGALPLAIDLALSSLNYYSGSTSGITVKGYDFKIAEQPIQVGPAPLNFTGTHSYEGGYDGYVDVMSGGGQSLKDLEFEVTGTIPNVGAVVISVRTNISL